ncbi:hypothetical protein [Actinomadura rudentiformis]|uniref:Uncharacterized protein n=1 Tax=Actinomadura rudentiformis TaxID=359158 RepID=A0A6H9YTK3_9ACTN|nr:hypothetical protein [Actinomadura rudentiformis]KAB2351604.1 hypothetical protein F8566_05105 [Actinomadura rudentiformis]
MKLRLVGLPDEIDDAVEAIGQVVEVLEVSAHYPRRGNTRQVSVYLDIRVKTAMRPGEVTRDDQD